MDRDIKAINTIWTDGEIVEYVPVIKGKWQVMDYERGGEHPLMMCDQCRCILTRFIEANNYCPNCGAKMEAEE